MRIAILFNRLGPYHWARVRGAAEEADVVAVEVTHEDTEYAWDRVDGAHGVEHVTVFPDRAPEAVPAAEQRAAVGAALAAAAPDVVAVPGWSVPAALAALDWCVATGVPAVVMSASTALDAPRRWWSEAVKRCVVRQFDAGLVGGTPHAAYLAALGVPAARVFVGYDVVDNAHFAAGAAAARADADAVRARLGLPARYFVAIGRFIPKKNLPRLLDAYAAYRRAAPRRGTEAPWDLVLLGDGPERAAVEERRARLGLETSVHLPGFKQYPALPAYYGLADAFVHASTTEQWGLVVNEAMAAGLPVVVSDRCGCAPDLVAPGRNGFTFDPYDTGALTDALLRLTAAPEAERAAMGAASAAIVDGYTPAVFGRNLRRAAEAARHAPPPEVVTRGRQALGAPPPPARPHAPLTEGAMRGL